ncbi:hypothetical protein BOTBODRAFT_470384 [Botryobasidium botryosum FD-172 SS1]|uniref:Uncharacterized protein n=1 Tax=Botryobasidium botryosum (strain FD-172 SS1) TaxID=930990 RepID=A0A067M641_BOTB1|nr:hypothetical protein BOTBODRAFT_470384 [Botryobasidium botryosum FD-172 SS1]
MTCLQKNEHIADSWCDRDDTVKALFKNLEQEHVVHVRGPPSSGKTTLRHLLHRHILNEHPSVAVFSCERWPQQQFAPRVSFELRLKDVLDGHDLPERAPYYLLIDEAQTSYWDMELWSNFLKFHQGSGSRGRVVLFCSYGSPSPMPVVFTNIAPIYLPPVARVSFRASQPSGAGLLLTHPEYEDFLRRQKKVFALDEDFKSLLYQWTRGHVGVLDSLLRCLISDHAEQIRSGAPLTLVQFHRQNPTWDGFLKRLAESMAGRGFPSVHDIQEHAPMFRQLLRVGQININRGQENQLLESLEACHKQGWLHTEEGDPGTRYRFPSPIHMAVVSSLLVSTNADIPYDTLYDLTIAALRRLKVRRGEKGKAREVEFYRSLHTLVNGNVVVTPEFISATGGVRRAGRIDFFVCGRKWGIECIQEGDKLEEHNSRFGDDGASYGAWLQSDDMTDYILLDFRTDTPTEVLRLDCKNLYHVVFKRDHTGVVILDNELQQQVVFGLRGD